MNVIKYEFLILLYFLTLISLYQAKISWKFNEILNPANDSQFCNTGNIRYPLICDPENKLTREFKYKFNNFLTNLSINTYCLCRPCTSPYNRIVPGVLIISEMNLNNSNNVENYAKQILHKWNIGKCPGNGLLIIVTDSQVHIQAGEKVKKYLKDSCIEIIERSAKYPSNLMTKLKRVFRNYIRYLRQPCWCSRTCYRHNHLRWLSNLVFFLAFILLIMCVGGITRRALKVKLIQHQRAFHSSRYSSNRTRPVDLVLDDDISAERAYRQTGGNVQSSHASIPVTTNVNFLNKPSNNDGLPSYSDITTVNKPPPYSSNQCSTNQHSSNQNQDSGTNQSQSTSISNTQPPPIRPNEMPPAYE